ncbi:PAS domain-containing protein [Anderseniella sp. Alg231-50]|uniref:PAS domain-containing protein n=1 Tax=Anderseniella sp. Alg231-50 TaxID=1922226 RepID=UPI000D550721
MSGTNQIINNVSDDAVMHPTSRRLLRTWERIRGEESAPLRNDITMRDLVSIIHWTCILNRDPHKLSYMYRLAGSAICETMGRQLTGTTAFDDWSNFDRETIIRGLDSVVGMKQPCVGRFMAYSYSGCEVGFEMVAVPVISANGRDVHALTTIAPFRDGRGVTADPLVEFHVRKIRILWSDHLPGKPASTPASSSDEVRRINSSFLRVIKGGKA